MPSKIRDSVVELNKIQYIEGNNSLNFTATPISGGAPIVDATAGVYANGAFVQANAAYSSSNTKLSTSGGTVNGDLAVAGNLIVSGTRIDINTATVLLNDNIVTINSDLPNNVLPTENAGIEVNRGSSTNVSILWNESTDNWTFTNDGVNYEVLGGGSAGSYANSAFLKANAAFNKANSAVNREAFIANNGQTVFQTNGYNIGYADVFVNGIKLYANTDFTANDGVYVTISDPILEQNDVVEIINWGGTAEPIAREDAYARNLSNASSIIANTAIVNANLAYLHANEAYNIANTLVSTSIDNFARLWANSAFIQANAAFSTANNVAPQVQPAFNKANSAVFYDANTSNTGFLAIPQGTTAQRPASAANGHIRYNTTLGALETYFPRGGWVTIAQDQYTVNYLIVAGGGGGAARIGSGGGAGGVVTGSLQVTPATSYSITVGSGGTAGQPGNYQDPNSTKGGNGSISIAFSQTAFGGGGGGGTDNGPGMAGGSGGGGGRPSATPGGAGTPGQGYSGGSGGGPTDRSGGGGGAGGPGASGPTSGNGGPGIVNPVPGSTTGQLSAGSYYLAGGGGGAGYNGPTPGSGGLGGGGPAGPSTVGTAGTSSTGGGGGGGVYDGGSGYTGGAGGSGVVIVYYVAPTQRGSGGTVTSYTSGSTTYWIHTFTGSGSFIA